VTDTWHLSNYLFTSTIHYSVSSCKCFTGSPNHQNSTAVLVFTSTIHYSVLACKCFGVYSTHRANTMLPLPSLFRVVHLATSQDSRLVQVQCSSCQTFCTVRIDFNFFSCFNFSTSSTEVHLGDALGGSVQLQLCDEQLGQPSRIAQRVKRVQYTCLVAQWVATLFGHQVDHLVK